MHNLYAKKDVKHGPKSNAATNSNSLHMYGIDSIPTGFSSLTADSWLVETASGVSYQPSRKAASSIKLTDN